MLNHPAVSHVVAVVAGLDAANALACRLMLESAFFQVTPLPCDEYEFAVKTDRQDLLHPVPVSIKETATAEITILLQYADAFDYEELGNIFHRAIDAAHVKGALDLQGGDNSEHQGVRIPCVKVNRVFANWRD
jgi:hypothetical protein